ncbi:hypothetical protein CNY89_08990 [Amaricoccus sp. HAR-UPW-R2A-40]|nr:hypothetical protein CNY89_08990 [Amaricoccus sp. HAR-UPW-R2A-40]
MAVEAKGLSDLDLRWSFELAFRVSIQLADGTTLDPEQARFEALAAVFGLSPAITGGSSAPGARSSGSPASIRGGRGIRFRRNGFQTGKPLSSRPSR